MDFYIERGMGCCDSINWLAPYAPWPIHRCKKRCKFLKNELNFKLLAFSGNSIEYRKREILHGFGYANPFHWHQGRLREQYGTILHRFQTIRVWEYPILLIRSQRTCRMRMEYYICYSVLIHTFWKCLELCLRKMTFQL